MQKVDHIGFCKDIGKEAAQQALSKFERDLAAAVIAVGNTGVDPAWIGTYLAEVGKFVACEGAGKVARVFAEQREPLPIEPDQEVMSKGGNPAGWMKWEMGQILGSLLGRPGKKQPADTSPGIGFLAPPKSIN